MVFMRLYSGTMTTGMSLWNPALGIREKVSRIFMMHANQRRRMERVEAGNIFGVLGLKKTRTGDTLCDEMKPVLLETIDAYEPVISQAVEPGTLRDKERLEESLAKLADEDPTFRWREDEGTGQTLISGMGELHLEILVSRLEREFKVPVRTGRPQVVYHEAVSATARHREVFDRGTEGDHVYGDVEVSIQPRERGAGHEITWAWPHEGEPLPAMWNDEVRKAVQEGVEQALGSGPIGHPLDDVSVTVTHIGFLEGPTKPIGYTIAASTAVRRGIEAASPVVLSPIANVEISTPPEFTGECIGSINQRRGRVDGMEERSAVLSGIKASVPMERMFGYATELRSMSQGRASFTMTFSHYDKL